MGEGSDRVRLAEFPRICAIMRRCMVLRADPDAWRGALAEDSVDLLRARNGHVVEVRDIWDDDRAQVLHMVETGWPSEAARAHFVAYQIDGAQAGDPARRAMVARRADKLAVAVSRILDFGAYRQHEVYRRYMAPADVGDVAAGIVRIGSSDRWLLIGAMRAADAPLFSRADVLRLRLLLDAIEPLLGRDLADSTSPVCRLTPRQYEALGLLLQGLSEREAAREMGVAPATFHKYVLRLYRVFGVHSRAALQAIVAGESAIGQTAGRSIDSRHHRLRREGAPMARPWRAPTHFRTRRARLSED